ncbi:DUF6702 family protein [Flavobacterium rivulicola]|uniref:DUF6702 family protein n=1 Tax=Flavobacterium rivulicola TaxID=2732161 RepID=UPI00197E49FF|nr:DUF6702 family protein [Flavobacterium sp. IMCC34852]
MKRIFKSVVLLLFFFGLSSMAAHRFYVAIYQIDFVPQKKRVEITTRIFMDDLNEAVTKAYKKNTNIGTEKETPEDTALLKKYLNENFKLTINGKPKAYNYISSEVESNVVICYLSIKEIIKISSIQVENSILTEVHSEQQNIIQFNNNGKKQNLLLSSSITKGMLK